MTGFAKSTAHPGQLNWSIEELRHDKTKALETLQEFRYAAHHNWEFLDEVTKFMLETQNQHDPVRSLIERFKTPLAKAAANRKINRGIDIQKKLFGERSPLAEFEPTGALAQDFERQKVESQHLFEQARVRQGQEEAGRERGRLIHDQQMEQKKREAELERQRILKEQEEEQKEQERIRREQEEKVRKEQEQQDRQAAEQARAKEVLLQQKLEQQRVKEQHLQQAAQDHPMPDADAGYGDKPRDPEKRPAEDDAESVSSESSPNIPAPVRKSSLTFASLPAREPVRKSSGRQSPLKHVKNKFSTILKNGRGLLASSAAVSAEAKASVLPSSDQGACDTRSVLSKTPSAEFRAPTISATVAPTNASSATLHKLAPDLKMNGNNSEEAQKRREEAMRKEREDHVDKKMREIEEESKRQEQRLQAARQEQQRRAAERAQAEEKEREKREKEHKEKQEKIRTSSELDRSLNDFAAHMAARENDRTRKEDTEKAKAAKGRAERQQRPYGTCQSSKQPEPPKKQIVRPQASAKILMPSQERQKRMVEEAASQRTRVEPPPKTQPTPQRVRPSLKHQASQEQVAPTAKRVRVSRDPAVQHPPRLNGPPIRPSGGTKKPMGWNDMPPPTTVKQPKVAHPMDMAKISKAAIQFAPNPSAAGPTVKTPARPDQITAPTAAAKYASRPSPSQFPSGDAIDLPEIFTDDEDEDYDNALVPSWANTPNVTEQLIRQEIINPMQIFGQPQPLDMEKVFEKSRERFASFRKRTSSANWSSGDQLTIEEVRKDLAARKKMRKDGAWTMDMAHQLS